MPAAARAGDKTSHAMKPLGPGLGSPNVKIGGMPAWRVGIDLHNCPQSDSAKAHVGGLVSKGSGKVYINGFPAAREGDQIVENGSVNSILIGFSKVQIGE